MALDLLTGQFRGIVVFCLLTLVYLATAAPAAINDTRSAAAQAWVVATHGTLDFREVGFEQVWQGVETPRGELVSNRFPGTWLLAVPFYAAMPGPDRPVRDQDSIPFGPAGLASSVVVAAAVVAMVEVLRTLVSARLALAVGLVVGLGTPVWSIAARSIWTHTGGILALAIALLATTRDRWWVVGAAFGWAIFTRPTHAITAAVFGLLVARWRRSWRVLLAVGLPSMAGLGALSVYSARVFGTWLPVAGYDVDRVGTVLGASAASLGEYTWPQQLWGTFFDLNHGVFPYSLVLVPTLLAVPAGWRLADDWVRASAISGAVYWVFQLRGNRFTGGLDFIGYRFPLDSLWLMLPLFAVGLAVWLHRSRAFVVVVSALAVLGIVLTGAVSVVYPTGQCNESGRLVGAPDCPAELLGRPRPG